MKKALKIIGIILLVIVLIVGIFAALNWKYIRALVDGLTMNETQLGEKRVETAEKALDNMNSYMEAEIRPLTEEEKAQIQAGVLSQTAVMAQIIAEATGIELTPVEPAPDGAQPDGTQPQQPDSQQNENGQTQTPEQPGQSEQSGQSGQTDQNGQGGQTEQPEPAKPASPDQLIAACVNKLYGLQAQYTAQLDGLAARARAYYDQQKPIVGAAAAKTSTFSKFSGEVTSMESSCDAKVEAALSELSAGLSSIGADTSIVGQLRSSYNAEKSNQRAAYVNRYLK